MRVNCPNCATVYNLPDDAAREGAKLRCSVCKHVFLLSGEALERPSLRPDPEQPDSDLDALLNAAEGEREDPMLAGASAPEEQSEPFFPDLDAVSDNLILSDNAGESASEEEILGLDEGEDLSFDLDSTARKPRNKKRSKGARGSRKSSPVLIVLLLLVGAGVAAYMFWDKIQEQFPFLSGEDPPEETPPPEEHPPGLPYDFSFSENLNHMFMDNSKVGRIFVIQGMVVNDYDTPKELIKLEAQLLDAQGGILASKTQIIGTTLSHYQLETFSEEELEAAINNEVAVLLSNTNVPPGGEVPFVIVFYNPPEDLVNEFVLRVVEAKDPPL